MKVLRFLLPIMICIIFIVGCDQSEPAEPVPESVGTIEEFFPFHENTLITFDDPNGPWGRVFYTVYVEGNTMQRLTMAGQFMVTEVFEIYGGELRINHASATASGFEPMLDMRDDSPMVILKEPLVVGNSWETHTGPTIQGVARGYSTITAVDVEITTPYGVVIAIEVSTEFENGYTSVDYFAKGIGLVQSGFFIQGFQRDVDDRRFFQEDLEVLLVLRSIEENTPFDVQYFVVFPNDSADDFDFAFGSFEFMTNGDIVPEFERFLRNPDGREYGLISPNTTINSIRVSWEQVPERPGFDVTTVHLDLSSDFVNDRNVGASYELLLLESLELTMRDFFNAHIFDLTIDGQPFDFGH